MKNRSLKLAIQMPLFFACLFACGLAFSQVPERVPPAEEAITILRTEESLEGNIYVVQEGPIRYLRFDSPDGDNQSSFSPDDPTSVPMEYVRLSTVVLAHIAPPKSMLMIGLGGGSYTTLLWRLFPDLQIDAVEISSTVWQLAREYFDLPDDARYRIHIEDGGQFMQNTKRDYDLIFIDAYTGEDLPAHLVTPEFFELTRTRLTESGAAVLNLAVSYDQETTMTRAFGDVFDSIWCYRGRQEANLILIGMASPEASNNNIRARAAELTLELSIPFDLAAEADHVADCDESPGSGIGALITDRMIRATARLKD